MEGMRYMLKKKESGGESVLEAVIWPEPYCYAKTGEEKKQRKVFALSPEGVEQAAGWLNEQYEARREYWKASKTFA